MMLLRRSTDDFASEIELRLSRYYFDCHDIILIVATFPSNLMSSRSVVILSL